MLSVLRITLFRPSSHKRGLERSLSTAIVQMCGTELRVSKTCLCAEFFKQAGVKASRFDVIAKFEVESITFFRRVGEFCEQMHICEWHSVGYLLL